jgi:hypothetical protein
VDHLQVQGQDQLPVEAEGADAALKVAPGHHFVLLHEVVFELLLPGVDFTN